MFKYCFKVIAIAAVLSGSSAWANEQDCLGLDPNNPAGIRPAIQACIQWQQRWNAPLIRQKLNRGPSGPSELMTATRTAATECAAGANNPACRSSAMELARKLAPLRPPQRNPVVAQPVIAPQGPMPGGNNNNLGPAPGGNNNNLGPAPAAPDAARQALFDALLREEADLARAIEESRLDAERERIAREDRARIDRGDRARLEREAARAQERHQDAEAGRIRAQLAQQEQARQREAQERQAQAERTRQADRNRLAEQDRLRRERERADQQARDQAARNRNVPEFGPYPGSEAEALIIARAIRLQDHNWPETIPLGRERIDIGAWGYARTDSEVYTIVGVDLSRATGIPLGTHLTQAELQAHRANEDLILAIGDESQIRLETITAPEFVLRPVNARQEAFIRRLHTEIDGRTQALNATAPNHFHVHERNHDGTLYVNGDAGFNGGPEMIAAFNNLLESIRTNNEPNFIRYVLETSTFFDEAHAGSKTSFLAAFTTLFVTKNFASIGTRAQYLHFILRCGHLE